MGKFKYLVYALLAILLVTLLFWTFTRSSNSEYAVLTTEGRFHVIQEGSRTYTSKEVEEFCPELEIKFQTTLFLSRTSPNTYLLLNDRVNVYGCSYFRFIRLRDVRDWR